MAKLTRPEQAFSDLLEGKTEEAPEAIRRMASIVQALGESAPTRPDPVFRARLRSQLMDRAAAAPEDLFALAAEGDDTPDEAVSPLVALIEALRPAERPRPEESFRLQLRHRLMTEAARRRPVRARVAERVAEWNGRMRRSARVVAAAGMAAAMMLGAGSAFAASINTVEGDPLYALKRWRESAQLSVSGGAAKGVKLLSFAERRLDEVQILVERGVAEGVPYILTLDAMDAQSIGGTEILIRIYRETRLRDTLDLVRNHAGSQRVRLAGLVDLLPASARPAALDSLSITAKVEQQVTAVLAGCSPCSDNPLAPPVTDAATSDHGTGLACECEVASGSTGSSSSPSGPSGNRGDGGSDGSDPGTIDPGTTDPGTTDPSDGDGPSTVLKPLPDVPETDSDDDLKEQVEGLLDDLKVEQPVEVTPALPPLPTL